MRKTKIVSMVIPLIVFFMIQGGFSAYQLVVSKTDSQNKKVVSQINVYPALPENIYMSDRYEVKVIAQDQALGSYVYKDLNNDPRWINVWPEAGAYLTLENHFTTFSFSAQAVVQITLPQRSAITSVVVRPLSKNLKATIKGNTISIPLNGPANFYVEIDGEKRYPLFVFANPPEMDVPSAADPNVIYFAPGIHEIGYKDGPMQQIPSGKTIYLAGGAYVKGILRMNNGSPITKIHGRGILSGIDVPGYSAYNGMIAVHLGSVDVEGIILLDAPQGYQGIIAFGENSVLNNVKMLAWAVESDSGLLGPNSQITGCFFKINDDVLKPIAPEMKITDNIVWQQMCGSVIMMGWNSVVEIKDVLISGIDVIGCDVGEVNDPKATTQGIINLKNSNGAIYRNMIIENVRLEKKPFMLFALEIKNTDPHWVNDSRYNKGLGSVDGLIFRNIHAPKVPTRISIFNGNGNVTPQSIGDIRNVTFENLSFEGTPLTEQNTSTFITQVGNTSNFNYK